MKSERAFQVIVSACFTSVATAAYVEKSRTTNVTIPDNGGWVSSPITLDTAPSNATVTGIDVYFRCVHTYSADLVVDLNADAQGSLGNKNLWNREGGSADNPTRTVNGITTFNGLSVNRTWYLYARDYEAGDTGYIDEWTIRVYYTATPAPSISSVSPNPIAADPDNNYQTLTINGSNFVNKPTVILTWTGEPGYTVSSSRVTFVSSTQVTISIRLGQEPDSWTVRVTNPDGQSSNTKPFTVVSPTPSISSVSPPSMPGLNGDQTLTINGSNFMPAATLTFDPPTGGNINSTESKFTSKSSTQLVYRINNANDVGTWQVKVNNPGGVSSGWATFTVSAPPTPDLVPENVGFSPSSVTVGGSFTISYRIRNLGPGNAGATIARMRLSLDQNLTLDDPGLVPLDENIPALPAGQYHDVSRSVTVPAGTAPGQYYVGVFADAGFALSQPTGNDAGLSPTRISINPVAQNPDLITENVGFSPSSVAVGGNFTINYRIRNLGPGDAGATIARMRLSLDQNLTLNDPGLSPLDENIPALTASQYYDVSRSVTVPAGTAPGQYYVGVFADAGFALNQPTSNDAGLSLTQIAVTGGSGTEQPLGIDVNGAKGFIEWSQVRSAGKQFAFVKATQGTGFTDLRIHENASNAKAHSLLVGAYHFALPLENPGVSGAIAEAQHFLNVAGPYIGDGYLPPALDIEDYPFGEDPNDPCVSGEGYTTGYYSLDLVCKLGKSQLSSWVRAWANQVESTTGVKPVIYMSRYYARFGMDADLNAYPLWIATNEGNPQGDPGNLGPWSTWTFQQYDWNGYVLGVGGGVLPVLLDSFNGDLAALYALANQTPPTVPADFDGDGDVDADDLESFQMCDSGPAMPRPAGCEARDFDSDGDVDQADFGTFQRCYSGQGRTPNQNCAD